MGLSEGMRERERTDADPLRLPRIMTTPRTAIGVSAAAIAIGLLSAAAVGWGTGLWQITVLYAGVILAAIALAIASSVGWAQRGQNLPSRALLRSLVDGGTEAIAITDAEGRLICANAPYGDLCEGYPSPLGLRPARGSELDRDTDRIAKAAAAALAGGVGRVPVELGSGEHSVEARLTCRALAGSGGYLLWSVNKTSFARSLEALSEQVGRSVGDVLARADRGLVLIDAEGGVLACNSLFAAWLRRPAEGLIGARIDSLFEREGGGRLRPVLAGAEAMRLDAAESAVAGSADGAPRAHLIVLSRVDEAPAAEQPGVSRDQLFALVDALPLSVAVAGGEGALLHANASFYGAFSGLPRQALRTIGDVVVNDDSRALADAVAHVASGGGKAQLGARLKSAPDSMIQLSVVAPGGTIGDGRAIVILQDSEEQRKLTQQLFQIQKMNAVGQLAGGIAHDFNNILTAIIGYSDLLLLRHSPGDAAFADVNQIRQNANRAANLVRQLLAFSRQQTMRPTIVQVNDVIGELSSLLKRLLGEAISLRLQHGRDLDLVRADPNQLEQVIVNLAVNAHDAMPGGGTLTIGTRMLKATEVASLGQDMMPVQDYVEIQVSDTGTGIPADILPNIFEPFFTTKEVGKGTGLGLSTVYGIIKQTGGFVFAESADGKGATFRIFLPAYRQTEADAAESPEAAGATPREPSAGFGRGTVLLVEDEDGVRLFASRALTNKGYQVLAAANGEEAMAILEAQGAEIDILVSDVVMPNMDGPTLVRAARVLYPDLKVIFISGYAEETLRQSIGDERTAFLPKPFTLDQLVEKVQRTRAAETA